MCIIKNENVARYVSITILFIINLLNYIDRYTVAAVLTKIQSYYNISDSSAGLIQTVFLISLMVGSPLCGYLGDRMNRKLIIIVGCVLWLAAVLASSVVPADKFWLFLMFRAFVGIGEASYVNVSPSIISDMFTGKTRSTVYMIFYYAVPVGSGLGFVIGSNVATWTGEWQWGIRVTAFMGIIALLFLIVFVREPERGGAERSEGAVEQYSSDERHYMQDIKALVQIPTFLFCTFGYTALIFMSGTVVWWEPAILQYSVAWDKGLNDTKALSSATKNNIGMMFGLMTTLSGLAGVSLGTAMCRMWLEGRFIFKYIKSRAANPLTSAFGSFGAVPFFLVLFLLGHRSMTQNWIIIFFANTGLSINWGLNADLIMSVVVPSRRSTAFSYFMLFSHMFGDSGGPYIIGALSDAIRGDHTDPEAQWKSLTKAICICVLVLFMSGVLYAIAAIFTVRDQENFKIEMGLIKEDKEEFSSEEYDSATNQSEDDIIRKKTSISMFDCDAARY